MPHITSSPAGESVSEVLNRIRVQDPRRKSIGIHAGRMSDYESPSPIRQAAIILTAAILVAGSFWSLGLLSFTGTWNKQPMVPRVIRPTQTREIPGFSKTARQPRQTASAHVQEMQETLPSPQNLDVRFLGPRSLEFHWDSLGQGYTYRLIGAGSPDFRQPVSLSEDPILGPYMSWLPDENINHVWVMVQGIDPAGKETAFSRPLYVRLPDE